MDIKLGKSVFSRDGEKIGTVDRLVIDPKREDLIEIIVHKGVLLTRDRLIERGFIENVDPDGTVHLKVTADKVEELPLFVREEYIAPNPAEALQEPYVVAAGRGGILWRAPSPSPHYGWYGRERDLLDPSSASAPEIEIRSNLPGNAVVVDRGSDVVDVDGAKLGTVIEIAVDADGELESLFVQTGHFGRHHEIDVPRSLIKSLTHKQVHLTVPASALKHRVVPTSGE